jgi:hypothetical protein
MFERLSYCLSQGPQMIVIAALAILFCAALLIGLI